jgi:hypothetical protein
MSVLPPTNHDHNRSLRKLVTTYLTCRHIPENRICEGEWKFAENVFEKPMQALQLLKRSRSELFSFLIAEGQ